MDFFGRAICHQIDERSLLVDGKVLSVCARDIGIYIGIFSTLIYLCLVKRKASITIPTVKMSFFLLFFMLPLMVDGVGSYAHLFESTNIRRLMTGICFGLVLPYFIYPLVMGKSLDATSKPVIKGSRDVFVPALLSGMLGGMSFYRWLPFLVLDGFIVLTIIVWFSLCAGCLLSRVHRLYLKWSLSILGGISFLTFLSWGHEWVLSLAN
ncbi:DUF2085 domain-containing protein [Neobacillus sp. SAB-20_R2A]|uniref:DUF2085 domain-containing protein n=1 Tax=Neobacillus sp. SAB-20_R2A TaxID=3120519 RepID=UPI003C6E969D